MDGRLLLLIFIISFNCKIGSTFILNWIWGTEKTNEMTVPIADGVPLISIPYESMTEDEKFLQEAAKFTDIQVSSPLETCQHRVIMKIKTSCSSMTEEQLAKLSVNLLNCQSAVEGRKMFPCTEEMSLKQCTTDMDPDVWNAYHLMNNRARAVCYAVRSTQFRALTELTVNKLMKSAHSQIEALNSMKQNQARLEEQTTEALSSLSAGNKALLEQQQYIKNAQITAHKLVTTNLRELNDEKALIRSGHAQLATMAEDIRNKLEKAHQDLEQQTIERGKNHKEILQDLIVIQEQAQSIWEKIESSTNRVLERHEETIVQYEQTLQKLTQINDTIQYIWNLTNTMRTEVDQKLGWVTDYIGNTGEQVQKVYRTVLHIVYILVAMIIAAFLQAPFLTRITIIGTVPVNLISYLKHGMEACLDFTSMTVLIFLITAMHFVMLGIQRILGINNSKAEPIKSNDQNGHSNGVVYKYTSSSYSNSMSKERLHMKLVRKIQEFSNIIVLQINYYIEKISTFVRSVVSWCSQKQDTHETLSCSYQPSKKKREDIIRRPEFSDMSNNTTADFSNMTHELSYHDNHNDDYDIDNIVDAFELKRRIRKVNMSPSRSTTPSFISPSVYCMGLTRIGRKCRKFASPGQNYCAVHVTGTSVVGDHFN